MAYFRRLPSGLWQATVRLPGGRRATQTDALKGTLRRWADELEADVRRGAWTDPRDGRLTVGEWYKRWRAARVVEQATADKEASHWRTHVEPRWADVQLAAVTSWDVEAWAAKMHRDGVGETTRLQSMRLLRHLMADAVRHRLIAADPTAGVKMPKPPKHIDRVLTREEYAALEAQLDGEPRAQVRLLALAGLRWQEMAGLQAQRVNPLKRELYVVEVLQRNGKLKLYPKSHAGQRFVPLVDELVDDLAPLLGRRGRLWPTMDYTNWRRRIFVPAVEAAGLAAPAPTPHDLRHSFGTWLADAGMPTHEVAALMGHGSMRSTERYVHAGAARMEKARGILSCVAGAS